MPPGETQLQTPLPPSPTPVTPSSARAIRTFRGDVQAEITGNNLSLTTIAQKEDERRQKNRIEAFKTPKNSTPPSKKRILAYAGGGLLTLLVLGGVGWGVFLYLTGGAPVRTPDGTTVVPESLIFAEKNDFIDISGVKTGDELLQKTQKTSQNLPLNGESITNILFTLKNGDVTVFADANSFLTATTHIPSSFSRSLGQNFMLGIYSTTRLSPFLTLTSDSYEIARAGMLSWENTLCQDLTSYVGTPDCPIQNAAWVDATIRNTDVREEKDSNGHVSALYSFLDRKTLVITENESTFIELLTRFHQPRPVTQ